jgi:hypothetical protein
MEAMRAAKIAPGDYVLPCAEDQKNWKTPDMIEKYNAGPVAFVSVLPSGLPNVARHLSLWFVYSLVVGVFVAYLTSRTTGAGAEYLQVFRVSGATAFIAYSTAHISDSIWKGQSWPLTFKYMFDGLIYGLLTAGTFAWLWPES